MKKIFLLILFLIFAKIIAGIFLSLIGFAVAFAFKIFIIGIFFIGCITLYKMISGKSLIRF